MNALSFAQQWLLALCGTGAVIGVVLSWFDHPVDLDDEQEVDGAPCCPDPGCPGRNGTFPRLRGLELMTMNLHTAVAVNEWGIPEPTPSQELWAEDVATYAGCPDEHCATVTVCAPCGKPVCASHSDFPADCVDNLGPHHEGCVADCVECSAARAQDHAEDRFERLAREGW